MNRLLGSIPLIDRPGTELRAATPRRLQIPPLRSCGAPVGMTRGAQLLSEKMATWMDGVKSGYSAKTADPLRSCGAPVGMTRGEGWPRLELLAGCEDPHCASPEGLLR